MKYHCILTFVAALSSLASIPAKAQQPYIGEIRYVAFNFAPQGWGLCDGQILPINQNQALFSLIGTTYGGDGVRTFALPDMRGRVPVATGQGTNLSNRVIGQLGGQETVALTVDQMPRHRHSLHASSAGANSLAPAGSVLADSTQAIYNTQSPDATLKPGSVGKTGGGAPHENMPPFLAMTCVIALEGIFPSQ
ncbi:MAG: tail fiber protein [Terriglobales bacterium]